SGHPAAAERLQSPQRDFGLTGPAPGVRPDGFSAAVERVTDIAGGRQTFHLSADGGARLWLDEELVVDNWPGPHVEAVLRVDLTDGRHSVHLEFNDSGGTSSFSLDTPPDRGLPTPTPSATATATPLPTRPAVTPFPTPGAAPSLTITRVDVQAADLAYSPLSGLVYAAVGAGAGAHAGELVAIDPVAGKVVGAAAMGGDPTLVAGASDGSMLYIALAGSGKVRAYDVLATAPDRVIGVGPEGSTATDLVVKPGEPRVVVAAVGTSAGHAAVVAVDDGRQLPVSLGPEVPSPRLAFADTAGALFGHGNAAAGLPIHVLRLDDQGVHLLRTVADLVSAPGADMTGAAGHLYFTTFQDIDATSLQESGRFPGANGRLLVPDPNTGAAYAAWGGALRIYRLGSHRGAGAIDVPGLGPLPHAMVRWGVDGLAIADDAAVWLVRGPAVATGGRGTGRTAWLPILIR
ncbi:MAG: PA14 domain-containing protein, partial [Anaerolineae bacterium]